ncbi:hypothetical protein PVL29_014383 [Vitis rotundifolia]|uniref:Uncharacterized protein n=1 Tax=Vitis rotundifolia TaxID=103349 RepID=A0AA38ZHF9_VITRO|nr:hypothetical protein PVL29_014383 [Vitis rotundifolia]
MEETGELVPKPRMKKGLWKPEEDLLLKKYVEAHGEGKWAAVAERTGLMRNGKSCRLRWKNYLRPNIKHGGISKDEEDLIIRMHKLLGNRWSLIAGRLPGRTDNDVKNYWNTRLNKGRSRGKRKSPSSDDNAGHKRPRGLPNSQPVRDGSPEKRSEGSDGRKQEESHNIPDNNPRMEDTKSFNHDIKSPLLPFVEDTAFLFYDEPFLSFSDAFVLFETLGEIEC